MRDIRNEVELTLVRANESVTGQKFNLDPCLARVGVLRLTETSLISCCKIILFAFFWSVNKRKNEMQMR